MKSPNRLSLVSTPRCGHYFKILIRSISRFCLASASFYLAHSSLFLLSGFLAVLYVNWWVWGVGALLVGQPPLRGFLPLFRSVSPVSGVVFYLASGPSCLTR